MWDPRDGVLQRGKESRLHSGSNEEEWEFMAKEQGGGVSGWELKDTSEEKGGLPFVAQRLTNTTSEDVGLNPGLPQWVKNLALP